MFWPLFVCFSPYLGVGGGPMGDRAHLLLQFSSLGNSKMEISKTDFFYIMTIHNDQISYVKHVLAPLYVFFTLFGYWRGGYGDLWGPMGTYRGLWGPMGWGAPTFCTPILTPTPPPRSSKHEVYIRHITHLVVYTAKTTCHIRHQTLYTILPWPCKDSFLGPDFVSSANHSM